MKAPLASFPHGGLLSRRDQVCVAAAVALCLVLMLAAALLSGLPAQRVLDVDRAGPLQHRFQLDVNRADWAEWTLLPGIGATLARRIVESRESEGPFGRHEDLLRVHGIGPRTLDGMRPYLLPVEPGAFSP